MTKIGRCLRNTVLIGLLVWIIYLITIFSYLELWGIKSKDKYSDIISFWSGESRNASFLLRQSINIQVTDVDIPNYPDMDVVKRIFNETELLKLGHNGGHVVLNKTLFPPSEIKKMEAAEKEHGFNEYLSNILPLNRKLPYIADEACKKVLYKSNLPKASVVICFMNESWSALLRTVHSVINTSPEHLLEEIILVDDFSDKQYLKTPLENYVSRLRIVRIIRAKKREGLIRGRLLGFRAATAPVVIFLDSHCECFPGWFEPIVGRIADNETNVPTPVIQAINTTSFSINVDKPGHVGILRFPSLLFDWIAIPRREKERLKSPADPIRSPAMAGGLFAVSKRFFERIGMYDPDLDTWGGENTELSLKTWMCGGAIEILPCSRVGHIFRSHANYKSAATGTFLFKNIARVAQVWLDWRKKFVPNIDGNIIGLGNVSQRIQLRKNLKCHSFQWYIDNVYPEMYIKGGGVYTGQIQSKSQPDKCIHSEYDKNKLILILIPCNTKRIISWDFTNIGEIKFSENSCWDVGFISGQVVLGNCHHAEGNQKWQYLDGMLRSLAISNDDINLCLSVIANSSLQMRPCFRKKNQQWVWHKQRPQRNV